jgi:hypothetical protein
MPSTPAIVLHHHPRQRATCLGGLVQYAQAIAQTPEARAYPSLDSVQRWLQRQPVKLDRGEGPSAQGCQPAQRSRIWPRDGLNCWEATAHYLGVAQALGAPLEVHVYDADMGTFRHVFPATRRLGERRPPRPVLLQPAASPSESRMAQGIGENALGAAHIAGTIALSAFGLGALSPVLERLEGDYLPSWAVLNKGTFEGALVKAKNSPRVYLISGGQRRWFVSPEAFLSRGYKWEDVRELEPDVVELYPPGPDVLPMNAPGTAQQQPALPSPPQPSAAIPPLASPSAAPAESPKVLVYATAADYLQATGQA